VHNAAGKKVGCGLLASYLPTTVTGVATASTTKKGGLELEWSLTGLEKGSKGGIHIHYGTSCQSEATIKGDAPAGANKGHYYVPDATPDASEDPWGPVKWESDVDGIAKGLYGISEAELGDAAVSAYNRVVVVHNAAGKKVGCGVLSFQRAASGCGADVTGGHYDPTLACGGSSQNQANGICALKACGLVQNNECGQVLRLQAKTVEVCSDPNYACTAGDQSQCEIGDQSGKMGKITGKNGLAKARKFTDRWMEPIDNLNGKSLVLHCCSAAGCGDRLACANLE